MHSLSPFHAIAICWEKRRLLLQFTQRMVSQRYRGSLLGVFWSLMTPLIMLAVYSFVFIVVFQVRFGEDAANSLTGSEMESKIRFVLMLFIGLILHGFLAECLTRSPKVIIENRNFVKKVIFPLDILPVTVVFSALFQLMVSFIVLLVAVLLMMHHIPMTVLWVPVILIPFVIFSFGVSWGLAALGVYVRDIAHIMQVVVPVLLFLSTIFYQPNQLPYPMDRLIYLNPISAIVDAMRSVVVMGVSPHFTMLGVYMLVSIVVFVMGYAFFQRTRHGFADVA